MNIVEIKTKLVNLDLSKYPDFYNLKKPSDKSMWILYVIKEEGICKRLPAEIIANLIRDVMEFSITSQSIYKSFNPLLKSGLIHSFDINGEKHYEIMKLGKEHILSFTSNEMSNILYFKPGERFKSKRILSTKLFDECTGDLLLVDPYIDLKTLDLLRDIRSNVKLITKFDHLNQRRRDALIRDINEFCGEYPNFEIKEYSQTALHDRYIISDNLLIISGYSLKDLGKSESFIIFLEASENHDLYSMVKNNFLIKWDNSQSIT